MKIKKVFESMEMPIKEGWYWILFDGYDSPTPCWFMIDKKYPESSCFLPAGLGDASRDGVYMNEITRIGPEIVEPKF